MKKESQNQSVLAYLEEHGSITVMEAFTELHITRLSARIYDLRARGHVIVSIPRRRGADHWVEYQLKRPPAEVELDGRPGVEAVGTGFGSEIITKNQGGQL